MDLHNSYRMQQCAIDNISDITVVMEQGILKINIFKTAMYMGGKKNLWKRTTQQWPFLLKIGRWESSKHWKTVLIENEVYQMTIEEKKKQTRMSKNSVEISFTVYQLSAKYCKVLLCSLQVFSHKLITKLASTTKTKLLLIKSCTFCNGMYPFVNRRSSH